MHELDGAFLCKTPGNDFQHEKDDGKVGGVVAASMVEMFLADTAVAQSMELLVI